MSDLIISGISHFNLLQTLDNGQAFRWEKTATSFCGVAHGRVVEISENGGNIILKNMTETDFLDTWLEYFDLGRDYITIREYLAEYGGEPLRKAIEFSPGLRLLKQDPWEMLISFIISQNNNIPRIKKMIKTLCKAFGDNLGGGHYAFPSAERLSKLNASDLDVIRGGYRTAYILDAARKTADGSFDIGECESLPTRLLYEKLCTIKGVGPKVANCVLLFGFGHIDIFPVDVWMKKITAKFYPSGFPADIAPYAGLAQQFLFHYVRMNPSEL